MATGRTSDVEWPNRDPRRPAYLTYLRVRYSDLDTLGHVNNAAYVTYMDQAAIDHAAALALDQERLKALGGWFIARRHLIDYLVPALTSDRLQILTWIAAMHGARATRFYEIQRRERDDPNPWPLPDRPLEPGEATPEFGSVILRARTDWAFVDVETGRPRRIPPDVMAVFA
jgi:acyl-CoA thioester hydrolase